MNPGDKSRCTPSLLPSTSLSGLEQFVPPAPAPGPHRSLGSTSWRFKPLPQLPSRVSSVYSRGCDEEKPAVTSENHVGFREDIGVSASEQRACDEPLYLSGQPKPEYTSGPSVEHFGRYQTAGGGRDVQATRRPASYDRAGQWTLFPTQKPLHARANRDSANSHETQRNKARVRSTGDLEHRSLIPAPLDIDGGQARRSPKPDAFCQSPSPATPEFSQFHSRHSSHRNRTISGTEHYFDDKQGVTRRGSSPWPTINSVGSRRNLTQENSAHSLKNESQIKESQIPRRPENNNFTNYKELYYSSSSNGSTNPDVLTYIDDRHTDYDYDDIYNNTDTGEEKLTYTHSIYPLPTQSPGHPPSSHHPFIQRPKQLAIPPTEYQKHGPKIWSSQNKQYRADLFPRCFRKFLPRSWKPPPETDQDNKSKEKQQGNGMEKILSNVVMPWPHPAHPRPRRPPRPPTSSSPGTPASPALPYLSLPDNLYTSGYFDDTFAALSGDGGFASFPPPSTSKHLASSISANDLSRRAEGKWLGGAVDGKRNRRQAELEVRRAKSEAVLGSEHVSAVVDGTGNYWL